jgi:predicted lipid-binding transport protein (Tim44 family)
MNKYSSMVAFLVIGVCLVLSGMTDAEAKRFGGGSSFGSRPAHNAPFQRSALPPSRSASQQQATNQNQMARQGMSQRGGMMGMLGGLALGGLLGALFFGGAFENINFMDILVLVGIAFVLYKLFAAKVGAAQQSSYQRSAYDTSSADMAAAPTGLNTDLLFKKQTDTSASQNVQQSKIPAGFDSNAFLAGAKIAYSSLQKAWDAKDLAEIRGLTTDKVFAEIQSQLKASTTDNVTDLLKLEAELLEVREIGSELEAVVLFDAIMREEVNGSTEQIKEVWHFVKPKASLQPKWLLDGIQQLED